MPTQTLSGQPGLAQGSGRGSERTQQPCPCWQMEGQLGIEETGAEARERGSGVRHSGPVLQQGRAMGCSPGLNIRERPESSAQLTPSLGTPESQLPPLCSHTLVSSVLPSGAGAGLPGHASRAGGCGAPAGSVPRLWSLPTHGHTGSLLKKTWCIQIIKQKNWSD